MAQVIPFYRVSGKYGCFSQFYERKFHDISGRVFMFAEQYMMYNKAILFGDKDAAARILSLTTPAAIKSEGRKVKNFKADVWDQHKYNIVVQGNFYKFSQNEDIKKILLETGSAILAEMTVNDSIWGTGVNSAVGTAWPGQNLLGRALMDVREQLLSQ